MTISIIGSKINSWLVGYWIKANYLLVGPGLVVGVLSIGRSLSKGSQPLFTQVSEKTMENSKQLGRQVSPGIKNQWKMNTLKILFLKSLIYLHNFSALMIIKKIFYLICCKNTSIV